MSASVAPVGTRNGKDRVQMFWERVDASDEFGCWPWRGARTTGGYGKMRDNDRQTVLVHRWFYEYLHGEIPDGLVIDHVCRNSLCLNPLHLEAVTQRTNVLRGTGPAAENFRMTTCRCGHELTPENVYFEGIQGAHRRCAICRSWYGYMRRESR